MKTPKPSFFFRFTTAGKVINRILKSLDGLKPQVTNYQRVIRDLEKGSWYEQFVISFGKTEESIFVFIKDKEVILSYKSDNASFGQEFVVASFLALNESNFQHWLASCMQARKIHSIMGNLSSDSIFINGIYQVNSPSGRVAVKIDYTNNSGNNHIYCYDDYTIHHMDRLNKYNPELCGENTVYSYVLSGWVYQIPKLETSRDLFVDKIMTWVRSDY